ncbi:hypothetical protein PFISCL1PPCAC_13848, partial [Pristionchus fissidentatus]
EREFHALIVIAFCDVDVASFGLGDTEARELDQLRERTFRELHVYYKRDLELSEYSQRLGNLLTIAHIAHEAGLIVCEEFRTYATMFDLNTNDALLSELFFN